MEKVLQIYRHYYWFDEQGSSVPYYVDIRFMEKDGFWLTKEMEITTGSNCRIWIPPGRLRYIEKIPPEEDG